MNKNQETDKWGEDLLKRLYEHALEEVRDERFARLLMRCMIDVAHTLCPEKSSQEHFDIIRSNLGEASKRGELRTVFTQPAAMPPYE